MNKTFKFVRVFESGEEVELPLEDVLEAIDAAKLAGGLTLTNTVTGAKTTMEAEEVFSIINQLGTMPKYRGVRLDAIEMSAGTH